MGTRFLQTKFWTSFKARHGWKTYYFKLDKDNNISQMKDGDGEENILSVLVRSFSIKIKKISIAYVPMAPEFNSDAEKYFSLLNKITVSLKSFLPENTVCVRFDPPIDFNDLSERDRFKKSALKISKKYGIVSSPVSVQPPDTTILNLLQQEEEILSGMKNKWRYNIKLASKKGVNVECYKADSPDFENAFNEFYRLFEATSKRDGVSFHGKDYYLDLFNQSINWNGFGERPEIRLYLARHEDDYLAGIITLFCKREAVYLYGASGNVKRNLMPAYLLQWTAICDAKNYGSPVYDFYGMPPTNDEKHPMHGLYLFKTGFGGDIIHRPGSYDAVLRKSDYKAYSLLERLRAWYHKVLLKKIVGR